MTEFEQRSIIALVFLVGFITKLLLMGFQKDKAMPDERLTINKWLWFNSQKWRVMGSLWFLVSLAFIAPHEGFVQLQSYVFHEVPVGHLSTAAIGFIGDDVFVSLDGITRYVKRKLNGERKEQ